MIASKLGDFERILFIGPSFLHHCLKDADGLGFVIVYNPLNSIHAALGVTTRSLSTILNESIHSTRNLPLSNPFVNTIDLFARSAHPQVIPAMPQWEYHPLAQFRISGLGFRSTGTKWNLKTTRRAGFKNITRFVFRAESLNTFVAFSIPKFGKSDNGLPFSPDPSIRSCNKHHFTVIRM